VPSWTIDFGASGIYRGFPEDRKIVSQLWGIGMPPLGVYDPTEKKLTKTFGAYPENSGVSKNSYAQVLKSHIVVDSDNRRVALFYQYTDLIEIYDVDSGERIARRHGPDGFYPKFKEVSTGNIVRAHPVTGARCAYFGCIERGGLIWASYGGHYFEGSDPVIYIYAFDWAGNPKMMFKLDHPICAFDVDVDNRIIYTSVEEKETGDFYLYKYKF
jgi:hypothetical protein